MYDTEAVRHMIAGAGFGDISLEFVARAGAYLNRRRGASGIIRGGPFAGETTRRDGVTQTPPLAARRRGEGKRLLEG